MSPLDRAGLVYAATVASPGAWTAVLWALEMAQGRCRACGNDRSASVFGEASHLLQEFTLPWEFCKYAAPHLWCISGAPT